MSEYTGPGVYELIPGNAPTKAVGVSGESSIGAAVKLSPATPQSDNVLWEIVAAGGTNGEPVVGDPEVGDRQYHILAAGSGLMLCAAEDGSKSNCLISTRSVRHPSCRWKMVPLQNGKYNFQNALGANSWLAVKGAATADGSDVMTWTKEENPHFQFTLKRPT